VSRAIPETAYPGPFTVPGLPVDQPAPGPCVLCGEPDDVDWAEYDFPSHRPPRRLVPICRAHRAHQVDLTHEQVTGLPHAPVMPPF
jgi:hypothetical protein